MGKLRREDLADPSLTALGRNQLFRYPDLELPRP